VLKSSEGIIVRSLKYGESSLILDIFSSDQGIRSYIIGGVRSQRARTKASMLQVLNIVNFVAYDKGGDKLNRIKEINYAHIYTSIPFDVVKGSLATFLIEICRKAIRASDAYEHLYNYIVKGLIHLDNTKEGLAHFHILFLIGLAKRLGFEMNNNYKPGEEDLFDLKEGRFTDMVSDHTLGMDRDLSFHFYNYLSKHLPYKVGKNERKVILNQLVDYYRYHIEGFGELKSLSVINTLYG